MNSFRIGIREGFLAARSPGLLIGASSYALLWGFGWWLAAPAVSAGFSNGAPADASGVIHFWSVTIAVLLPLLVLRTVLEPDRSGLIEWRLSGPLRPAGLASSLLITTAIAISLFSLPMLPIVGASLAHGAPVASLLGHAGASVLLLVMWAAIVVAISVWLRSTFFTLLFTLMFPALGLGAVAALPLLADRVDDVGFGWASSQLTRAARQLASIHPLQLSRGLLDGQMEFSSLVNVGLLSLFSFFAASEGLRLRAYSGQIWLRRHASIRGLGFAALAMFMFAASSQNISGALDLTPRSRVRPSPRLKEAMAALPQGSTVLLALDGNQVPPDDVLFASRILQRSAQAASVQALCIDLAALNRGEIPSHQIANWQSLFSDATTRPNQITDAVTFLELQSKCLTPSEHADVIVGIEESVRRVKAGLQRGVFPDLSSIARQLSAALQQLAAAQTNSSLQSDSLRMAKQLLVLADDDQFLAAKVFSKNGGMALIHKGEVHAFCETDSFVVQFAGQTPLRSEAALAQTIEEFAGTQPPIVSVMAPDGNQKLLRSVEYELRRRGLRVLPFKDNNPKSVLMILADPPPTVEADPAGFAFVRKVAGAIQDPSQDAVLCLGPSVRSRYDLDSPWENLLAQLGVDVVLKSPLGESVTRRTVRQTDLLIRPDWTSDHPVSNSVGALPVAFPLAVDLGTDGACFQWLPSSRRGRVSNWTSPNAFVEEASEAMGLVRLVEENGRRLAVVGSARWLSPSLKSNPNSLGATAGNHELASSLVRWASGQDVLGQGPNAALGRFQPSAFERVLWIAFAVGVIPLGLALAGCRSAWGRSR